MSELDKALQYARDQGVSDRQLATLVKVHTDEVRFRQTDGVTLTHPDLDDREITVPESSVEQYQKSGWVPKPTDEPTEQPAEDVKAAETEEK